MSAQCEKEKPFVADASRASSISDGGEVSMEPSEVVNNPKRETNREVRNRRILVVVGILVLAFLVYHHYRPLPGNVFVGLGSPKQEALFHRRKCLNLMRHARFTECTLRDAKKEGLGWCPLCYPAPGPTRRWVQEERTMLLVLAGLVDINAKDRLRLTCCASCQM